jgi:hypothetical protein
MKVDYISEPEWAEGREVTLMPETYNVTGLSQEEFSVITTALLQYGSTKGSTSAMVVAAKFHEQWEALSPDHKV